MAVKAIYEKQEDIPAPLREHYAEVTAQDGKKSWRLAVEKVGDWELTDAAPALINTIEKLRPSEAKLRKFGTITPDEAIASAARIGELQQQLEDASKKGGKLSDSEKTQITNELKRLHEVELAKEKARSDARLSEVHRLRKRVASDLGLRKAGYEGAMVDLLTEKLVLELDVVEDESAAGDARFRTVVRGDGGQERIVADTVTKQARTMTAEDRAIEYAAHPEWKRYLPAKAPPTPDPKTTGRGMTQPAATKKQPADTAARAQPPESPIERLHAALAASSPAQSP